jgi:glycosyltransferase involved in cell wall biosynthesis
MDSDIPFVSVIVPVFNDCGSLRTCLDALARQTYSPSAYEVIVVDNGGNDGIENLASEYPQARVLCEPGPGAYAARNRGLSEARGTLIAFTDADCIPAPDWLENGARELLRIPDCGLVAGKIEIIPRDPARPTAVELYQGIAALQQDTYVAAGRFGATANLFTFRTVFDAVGGFDGEVKSSGDLEWGQRVDAAGYQVVYTEHARVVHPARRTLGQLYRQVTRMIGGVHDLKRRKDCVFLGIDRGLFGDLLPPVRYSLRVMKDPRLASAGEKLKVVLVLFFVRYVEAYERIRLRLGGRSRR